MRSDDMFVLTVLWQERRLEEARTRRMAQEARRAGPARPRRLATLFRWPFSGAGAADRPPIEASAPKTTTA